MAIFVSGDVVNLFEEIKNECEKFNKDISDVIILYNGEIADDLSVFKDIDYDNGYGICKVRDLQIIIDEYTWLERGSYDGCERFYLKAHPLNSKYENKEVHY